MKCQTRKLYKGVFNVYGEIHELYRYSRCGANQAKNYMIMALAKKLGVDTRVMRSLFSGRKDNFKVQHHRGKSDTAGKGEVNAN